MDTAKDAKPENGKTPVNITLIQTVADNKSKYTVELARKIQSMIGSPCLVDYLCIVDNNEFCCEDFGLYMEEMRIHLHRSKVRLSL